MSYEAETGSLKRPLDFTVEDGRNKRARGANPSKVVYFRTLPHNTTDAEINALTSPFGILINVLKLPNKNQAFVEFDTIEGATAFLQAYREQATIRGQPVQIAYSDRPTISFARDLHESPPNRILFVVITLLIHHVDCNTLYQVFSRVGTVKKVVLQMKNGQQQGFVEMEDTAQAEAAKAQFNNKHIFASSCKMGVQFSKLFALDCKDPRCSHDFTLGPWPEPEPGQPQAGTMILNPVMPGTDPAGVEYPVADPNLPPVLLVNHLDERVKPDDLFKLFGTCGDVIKVKICYNKRDSALLEFRNGAQAKSALDHLAGVPLYGKTLHVMASNKRYITLPNSSSPEHVDSGLSAEYHDVPLHRFKNQSSRHFQYIRSPCQVLHVCNVPPHMGEGGLRELFNPYGCQSVEMFKADMGMATVAMVSTEAAVHAIVSLHGFDTGIPDQKPLILSFATDSQQHSSGVTPVAQPAAGAVALYQPQPMMQQPFYSQAQQMGYPYGPYPIPYGQPMAPQAPTQMTPEQWAYYQQFSGYAQPHMPDGQVPMQQPMQQMPQMQAMPGMPPMQAAPEAPVAFAPPGLQDE